MGTACQLIYAVCRDHSIDDGQYSPYKLFRFKLVATKHNG